LLSIDRSGATAAPPERLFPLRSQRLQTMAAARYFCFLVWPWWATAIPI